MSRLVWHPDVPENVGMYWYDSGFRQPGVRPSTPIAPPLVLQVRPGNDGNYSWCYGPYGSGPLNVYYHKSMAKKCRHAQMPDPKKWVELSTVRGQKNYGWFKDTKGHYGFGILDAGWGGHSYVTGTWIWVNHPSCAADHGGDVQWSDGWSWSPVKIPEV